jgi:hypothetical protein
MNEISSIEGIGILRRLQASRTPIDLDIKHGSLYIALSAALVVGAGDDSVEFALGNSGVVSLKWPADASGEWLDVAAVYRKKGIKSFLELKMGDFTVLVTERTR